MQTEEEEEQKQILKLILQKRNHQSIKMSLMIKDFVQEAQELRAELQAGDGTKFEAYFKMVKVNVITCKVELHVITFSFTLLKFKLNLCLSKLSKLITLVR